MMLRGVFLALLPHRRPAGIPRARLEQLGIEPYSVDDVVVTVTDPDGRKVLFGTA